MTLKEAAHNDIYRNFINILDMVPVLFMWIESHRKYGIYESHWRIERWNCNIGKFTIAMWNNTVAVFHSLHEIMPQLWDSLILIYAYPKNGQGLTSVCVCVYVCMRVLACCTGRLLAHQRAIYLTACRIWMQKTWIF